LNVQSLQTRCHLCSTLYSCNCSCTAGYQLTGNATLSCNKQGAWPFPPSCLRVCLAPFLFVPHSASNDNRTYVEGDSVRLSCEQGFAPSSVSPVTCNGDGEWLNLPPNLSCVRIACVLQSRDHLVVSDYTNSSVSFTCTEGYTLQGSAQSNCQEGGAWSPPFPYCEPVDCGPAPSIASGGIHYTNTTFGSNATYYCDAGYSMIGIPTLRCEGNSSWAPDSPQCQLIDCASDFSHILNADVYLNATSYGSEATVVCHTGYTRPHNSTSVCTEDGSWKPEVRYLIRCQLRYIIYM